MDVLGDIGLHDQLCVLREENKVLQEKVQQYQNDIQQLMIQNTILQSELNIYRQKEVELEIQKEITLLKEEGEGEGSTTTNTCSVPTELLYQWNSALSIQNKSNIYCSIPSYCISNIHNQYNPICITILNNNNNNNSTKMISVITGGADSILKCTNIVSSSSSSSISKTIKEDVVHDIVNDTNDDDNTMTRNFCTSSSDNDNCQLQLTAPIVCMTKMTTPGNASSSSSSSYVLDQYIIAGTMDGHVSLIQFFNSDTTSATTTNVIQQELEQQHQPKIIHSSSSTLQSSKSSNTTLLKHEKYISSISWIQVQLQEQEHEGGISYVSSSWLATASADGTIHVYYMQMIQDIISTNNNDNNGSSNRIGGVVVHIQHIETLYFDESVTCICYGYTGSTDNNSQKNDTASNNDVKTDDEVVLYAYVRMTPHIKVIRMPPYSVVAITDDGSSNSSSSIDVIDIHDKQCCTISYLHLNTSLYDHHVSFAILDMKISYNHQYIAVACDNHCHFIIATINCNNTITKVSDNNNNNNNSTSTTKTTTTQLANIVRKLYGHTADTYSRPILCWSYNDQYIYSNTQNDTKLCIFSLASGKLIENDTKEDMNVDTVDTIKNNQQKQQQQHERPIKDLCSSPYDNVVITISFDRTMIVWTGN